MSNIMLSSRKVNKKIAKLTDYKTLLDEIKLKFSNMNLTELTLTYKFDHEQEQMQLLNDQSIDAIRNAKKNTKIFICKAKSSKLQNSGQLTQSSLEKSSFTTQKSIKTYQILKNADIKGQLNDFQVKQKCQKAEKLIERPEHVADQQENLYCHVGVSCFRCKCSNIVGNRYKCQICPDFNFCNGCYKLRQEQAVHQPSHKFYIIKNHMFFNAINYFEVFSHFFGYKINQQQKGNMNLRQFHIKNPKFNKQIQYCRQKLVQLLDENLQNWQNQFQAQLSNKK